MKEIWKTIDGYDGEYKISNRGNVYAKKLGRNLAIKTNVKGYKFVHLSLKGSRKIFYIHRLVAEYFIPNKYKQSQVNHIDENKSNNVVSNLEWVSCKENIRHSKAKPVIGTNLKTGRKIFYNSLVDVDRDGFHFGCVALCCSRKQKKHKGYAWRFMERNEYL